MVRLYQPVPILVLLQNGCERAFDRRSQLFEPNGGRLSPDPAPPQSKIRPR